MCITASEGWTPLPGNVSSGVRQAVIELSGVGRVHPSSFFNPPACSQKLPLGGQANPTRAAFNSSMYLALCLHKKISNTCELQDDPIIRGYDSLVDYLLIY